MSRAKLLANIIDAQRRDTDEAKKVLRLQAMAWRLLTMIALADPKRARGAAQWLLVQTVPFTNATEVQAWITENEAYAIECAKAAGVVE